MLNDAVAKLVAFGFTQNQAKVYLSIVQSGSTTVDRISKITQLHRQDIYKLLPKLEKMGLIIKTIDKPFMLEAIPIDKALENVIFKERQKAIQKITCLEKNLKEMVNVIQEQPEIKEDTRFTLLTTDEAIKNKSKFIYKKSRKQFLVITTMDQILRPGLHTFRDYLQDIAGTKAKLQLVIMGQENEGIIKETIQKIAPRNMKIQVRHVQKNVNRNLQLIDNKEAWLATQQKTETGSPCILWTNDQNIVSICHEHFKGIWNNPKARTVYYRKETGDFISQLNDETLMPSPFLA